VVLAVVIVVVEAVRNHAPAELGLLAGLLTATLLVGARLLQDLPYRGAPG
jgi:hypothetical protein